MQPQDQRSELDYYSSYLFYAIYLFYLFHAYSRVSLTDVSIQLVTKAFGILISLSLLRLFITGLEINGL